MVVEAFVVNVRGAANADHDGLLQVGSRGWQAGVRGSGGQQSAVGRHAWRWWEAWGGGQVQMAAVGRRGSSQACTTRAGRGGLSKAPGPASRACQELLLLPAAPDQLTCRAPYLPSWPQPLLKRWNVGALEMEAFGLPAVQVGATRVGQDSPRRLCGQPGAQRVWFPVQSLAAATHPHAHKPNNAPWPPAPPPLYGLQAVVEFKWHKFARRLLLLELAFFLVWLLSFFSFTILFQARPLARPWPLARPVLSPAPGSCTPGMPRIPRMPAAKGWAPASASLPCRGAHRAYSLGALQLNRRHHAFIEPSTTNQLKPGCTASAPLAAGRGRKGGAV